MNHTELKEKLSAVIEMYRIKIDDRDMEIHKPNYICIPSKLVKSVIDDGVTLQVSTDHYSLLLWKNVSITHTMVK